MSAFGQQRTFHKPYGGPKPKPRETGVPVKALINPPIPEVSLHWDAKSQQNYHLGSVAIACKNTNNWGMFNWNKNREPKCYSTEHPASTKAKPKLNTLPMFALSKAKELFEASEYCSSFTIIDQEGRQWSIEQCESIEWLDEEDLAESEEQSAADDFDSVLQQTEAASLRPALLPHCTQRFNCSCVFRAGG